MSDDEIVWEDPPRARRGARPRKLLRFVEALKSRHGEWARYGRCTTMPSYNRKRYPGTEWAARVIDGQKFLYARWVGLNGEYK